MNFSDTNFIGVVNADTYESFVDEDWKLDGLLQHFGDEMKRGKILVYQMTEEGIEHAWNVDVRVGTEELIHPCFRKAVGYIEVTENRLYVVDYDCLTMAAQFQDSQVPDQNCSKYKIDIENGFYQVEAIQYFNADTDEYVGARETDLLFHFIKVPAITQTADKVFWCIY